MKSKIIWLIWILVVFLVFGAIGRNIRKIGLIRERIEQERMVVAKMEAENKKLQEKILATQDLNFLEREARNKLGFIKEGEVVVVLPDEEILKKLAPQAQIIENEGLDPNWKQWLKLFN